MSRAFERDRKFEPAPGKFFPLTSPEDIVITKQRWFVFGNQKSDRQWNDIIHVLELQADALDHSYLERWPKHFSVDELYVRAANQAKDK